MTKTKTWPCSFGNKTLEEEKGGVSCQLDSGGKRLTSDHLETVTSPLFRPRPVPQITCRGWNPPPRSSYFQCGPDRLLRRRSPGRGDFSPGPVPAPALRPAAAAVPQTRPWLGPRPPALPAPAVAVVAAPRCWPAGPERDMWRVTLLQLSQPTNLRKRSQRAPDRHVSAAPAGLPACHFRCVAVKGPPQGKKKKKAPYLASSPGPKSPGSSRARVISVQNQRPAMLPFQPGGQEKPQNLLFLGSRS